MQKGLISLALGTFLSGCSYYGPDGSSVYTPPWAIPPKTVSSQNYNPQPTHQQISRPISRYRTEPIEYERKYIDESGAGLEILISNHPAFANLTKTNFMSYPLIDGQVDLSRGAVYNYKSGEKFMISPAISPKFAGHKIKLIGMDPSHNLVDQKEMMILENGDPEDLREMNVDKMIKLGGTGLWRFKWCMFGQVMAIQYINVRE